MIVKLQTEHHLEVLSLNAGCRGSSESTLVKTSNCWKSHAAAHVSCSTTQHSPYGESGTRDPSIFSLTLYRGQKYHLSARNYE